MDKITLAQFWEQLDKHDWYHEMSDDHRVDAKGAADWRRLEGIAQGKPEFEQMMKDFNAHFYTGKPWNTEQKPKPEKPLTPSVNSDSVKVGDNDF